MTEDIFEIVGRLREDAAGLANVVDRLADKFPAGDPNVPLFYKAKAKMLRLFSSQMALLGARMEKDVVKVKGVLG